METLISSSYSHNISLSLSNFHSGFYDKHDTKMENKLYFSKKIVIDNNINGENKLTCNSLFAYQLVK